MTRSAFSKTLLAIGDGRFHKQRSRDDQRGRNKLIDGEGGDSAVEHLTVRNANNATVASGTSAKTLPTAEFPIAATVISEPRISDRTRPNWSRAPRRSRSGRR
jgi:hypothetical protein